MMKAMNTDIIYELDAADCLVEVNDAWDVFGAANYANDFLESLVLRRSIWDFIVDRETRLIYEMMFQKVREQGSVVTFPFRCDAPNRRRFMQMELSPLGNKHIRIVSRVLHEEERTYVALLDPTQVRSNDFITICSWCKKIELPSGAWAEVEEALVTLDLFADPLLPQLSHGICPACMHSFSGWRLEKVE